LNSSCEFHNCCFVYDLLIEVGQYANFVFVLFIIVSTVEECDARNDAQGTLAGTKKIKQQKHILFSAALSVLVLLQ